jgi:NAD(P)-dependent dehydrogenase (short-subunit alcohol dehydrogenase family)
MNAPWQRAIVVGASSGIGAEIARQLAREGCRVALVARRAAELGRLAEEIGGSPAACVYTHDVTAFDGVPALFERICRDLGGLDLVVYAAGVMPRVGETEYAFAKDREIVEVNVLGAIAWLNEAAQRFERGGAGTIVGLSSVAGDRGRRGNPVYCASKAALTAYLEALRNRLARRGVVVVTVKPGPVATPMTAGMDRLPLLVPVEKAAREILDAARRGASTAYVPRVWAPIMFVVRHLPSAVMRRLDL